MQKFQNVIGPFRAEASRSKIRFFFSRLLNIIHIQSYLSYTDKSAYIRYLKRPVCEIQITIEHA